MVSATWYILPFELFFLFVALESVMDRRLQHQHAGNPPGCRPGRTWGDYFDHLVKHPIQRLNARRHILHLRACQSTPTTSEAHRTDLTSPISREPRLPLELCNLIIEFCTHDKQTLDACSLVCLSFLHQSRRVMMQEAAHVFTAHRYRAYTLVRLLRSPFCTFPSAPIRHLTLKDEQRWDITESVLRELVRAKVEVQRLDLRLWRRVPCVRGGGLVDFEGLNLQHLEIDYRVSASQDQRQLAAFICLFPTLESLSLTLGASTAFDGTLHHAMHLSPRLRCLAIQTAAHRPKAILHWLLDQRPQLRELHLMTGFLPEDTEIIQRYLADPDCGGKLEKLGLFVKMGIGREACEFSFHLSFSVAEHHHSASTLKQVIETFATLSQSPDPPLSNIHTLQIACQQHVFSPLLDAQLPSALDEVLRAVLACCSHQQLAEMWMDLSTFVNMWSEVDCVLSSLDDNRSVSGEKWGWTYSPRKTSLNRPWYPQHPPGTIVVKPSQEARSGQQWTSGVMMRKVYVRELLKEYVFGFSMENFR